MSRLICDSCCGCVDLKTGCFIIGYVQLIANIIVVFLGSELASLYFVILNVVGIKNINEVTQQYKDDEMGATIVKILNYPKADFVYVIEGLLFIPFIVVFLVGLHRNKRVCLMIYLVSLCVYLVMQLTTLIALGGSISSSAMTLSGIYIVINLLPNLYSIMVIRSQYSTMGITNGNILYNTNVNCNDHTTEQQ